ncbi:hypothetical protein TVAG_385980 [Trichomonas vaginalis G3]|uniref:DUF3447 domain-containing protein n=1 Tax=Trichomonas vaginalis (strain ATCC PRA-98 / G3) TaxID=412133 RepID=A2FZN7_TRIV3|nr:histone-lysine N-methyltransferase family [Trichomonas vaginalis G3]EAX89628.1 hypothetical protein TVAG_385980 [Trichomonas vaginalis G3]KAI5553861.1 histone-lysine N-methyltransferase family [Trichomonas vaginalis G3]|eukprot:XP_001302558.1 hypothetical protein [Trichomonas vaginalis G3]
MNDDLKSFIMFTEETDFDPSIRFFATKLYPLKYYELSFIELCCYHGAVNCFKLLRSKFNSQITKGCLQLSFLGGNPEILNECLKYQKPNDECMDFAIASHNIDFVTFLMNEHKLQINLNKCIEYKNLQAFFIYLDQTKDIKNCFVKSTSFNIPSLCAYLLNNGANLKMCDEYFTPFQTAINYDCLEMVEFLIDSGGSIHTVDEYGKSLLHDAAASNSKRIIEFLIAHGLDVNCKDNDGYTPLHQAAEFNCLEATEQLIVHGANINEKCDLGDTALHIAAENDSIEVAEYFVSHGIDIFAKNNEEKDAAYIAAWEFHKEILNNIISYLPNESDKDSYYEIMDRER